MQLISSSFLWRYARWHHWKWHEASTINHLRASVKSFMSGYAGTYAHDHIYDPEVAENSQMAQYTWPWGCCELNVRHGSSVGYSARLGYWRQAIPFDKKCIRLSKIRHWPKGIDGLFYRARFVIKLKGVTIKIDYIKKTNLYIKA